MLSDRTVKRIAFLGTSPPRRCGIGTFTSDLSEAIARRAPDAEVWVIAMNQEHEKFQYPERVRFQIQQSEPEDYRRAATFLAINDFDVVCVQHEFGIFGGDDGGLLLEFMSSLRVPIVTTFHTVLQEPSPGQRRIMESLKAISARMVVMSEKAQYMLRDVYDIDPDKIDLIPHGIPELPFIDPDFDKEEFGTLGKTVILTFGLISPNKGIEFMIQALPKIIEKHPNVEYFVIGATHPNVLREHGESYREMLIDLAKSLGVEKNVRFVNEFLSLDELLKYIGASDIYVTPYQAREQISSGALSYAFGLGKACISTPYWYAEELLADERGILVPMGSPEAIAEACVKLIDDPDERLRLRKNAYSHSRSMVWRAVAEQYLNTFMVARNEARFVAEPALIARQKETRELPPLNLNHLQRMSDRTGILEYAIHATPNYDFGYTTEQNARALILMTKLAELPTPPAGFPMEWYVLTYMSFLWHAFDKDRQRFRQAMSFDRRWRGSSEEAHGWAMRSIGYVLGGNFPDRTEGVAGALWEKGLEVAPSFRDLRACAHVVVGIDRYLRRLRGDLQALKICDILSARLLEAFNKNSGPGWAWFEEELTGTNAVIPQAMLVAGKWLEDDRRTQVGLESLRWLCEQQYLDDRFVPIGNKPWMKGQPRPRFDQTTSESATTISAVIDAHDADECDYWLDVAQRAFDWFLGLNDLNTPLYDPETGGCRDALQSDRLNQNQGAEATLSYLISALNIRKKIAFNGIDSDKDAGQALILTRPGGAKDGAGSPV